MFMHFILPLSIFAICTIAVFISSAVETFRTSSRIERILMMIIAITICVSIPVAFVENIGRLCYVMFFAPVMAIIIVIYKEARKKLTNDDK